MKVILVTEYYYPHVGGVTEHVHHLARYLSLAGHQVRVLTSHVEGAERRPDVESVEDFEVVRMGHGMPIQSNGSQARVTVGWGLDARMRSELRGADIVHLQSPLFPMLPYLAIKTARRLDIPVVGTFHTNFAGSPLLDAFRPLLGNYVKGIDQCIAVSHSAIRSASPYVDAPFLMIPNGVDVKAWGAGQRRPELEGLRNIVFLGRLDPRNDVDTLLQAYFELIRRRPDVRLVIVGGGPERPQYEAMVPSHLKDRVVFAGLQTDVAVRAGYLASADLMAFTIRLAAHPITVLEGLAAGCPIVAYDIEGVRELVENGREGYRVPIGDLPALVEGFDQVLAHDERRKQMSLNARLRAEPFDWRHITARILTVYENLRSGVAGNQVRDPLPTQVSHQVVE